MSAGPNSSFSVVVIDDEVDLLDMYEFELIDFGFKPTTFNSSVEACKAIKNGNFDLVISDVRMPSLNGLDMLSELSKSMANPPPFIFVTGYSQYDREDLIEAGAKEVFMKPVDVEKIVHWIDTYLQR